MSKLEPNEWICAALVPVPVVQTRQIVDRELVWPRDSTLTIGFLDGSTILQNRVFETACRWILPAEGGAKLTFQKANFSPETADIRISFAAEMGSWSRIGMDAKNVELDKPTMNLGWATETTPEEKFASVVLHEFGHALGMLHEHNHPRAELNWNRDAVYADLMGPTNNWSKEMVDYNVFASYPPGRVLMTDKPDYVSVMIYTIPKHWLIDQEAVIPSNHLSPGDIKFIRSIYY